MINGRTPDPQLGKSDYDDGDNDQERIKAKSCSSENPRQNNPDQKITDRNGEVTAEY
jgi:hypothetical protein